MYHDLDNFVTQDGDRLRDLEADRVSAGKRFQEYWEQLADASRQYQEFPTTANRRRKEITEALASRAAREHNQIADKAAAALQDAQWQALAGW